MRQSNHIVYPIFRIWFQQGADKIPSMSHGGIRQRPNDLQDTRVTKIQLSKTTSVDINTYIYTKEMQDPEMEKQIPRLHAAETERSTYTAEFPS